MHANSSTRGNGAENSRLSPRTPVGRGAIPLPRLLALQGSVGNAAVVQILHRTGYPWAQEEHEHSAGCGHQPAERPVQRSAVPDVLRSPGSPLDDDTRNEMEARLGADFADIRAQTDTTARASAAEVGAHAYTSGNHVVTGDGGDKHTLAHELTHVIQQRKGPVAGTDSGYGLKGSDPSDRFERAAEENAHRVMSVSSSVQREAVDAWRGPSTAGGGAPVQRTFQMTSKTYDAANAEELTEAMFDKAKGGQRHWTGEVKKTVVAQARQMAKAEAFYRRFRSHDELLNSALQLVNQATAAGLPAVAPGPVRTGSPEPAEGVEPAVEITGQEKISRLANFRRRASDVSRQKELDEFRDTKKGVSGFTYNHVPDSKYTIGHTSNFLLGDSDKHAYEELFALARINTGLDDAALASRFVHALSHPGDAFEGLPAEGRKHCAKVVALIQGPELRRAAGNPTVAIAAFNKVVSTQGLTLENALSQYAMFAVAGGSAESQFHRKEVLETPEMRQRALNEYDSLAELVRVNGFPTDTEEQFLNGCQYVVNANMDAFKKTISYS